MSPAVTGMRAATRTALLESVAAIDKMAAPVTAAIVEEGLVSTFREVVKAG